MQVETRTYHVMLQDQTWRVKAEDASFSPTSHPTREQAIVAASALASCDERAVVVVHDREGHIDWERLFSTDPAERPRRALAGASSGSSGSARRSSAATARRTA